MGRPTNARIQPQNVKRVALTIDFPGHPNFAPRPPIVQAFNPEGSKPAQIRLERGPDVLAEAEALAKAGLPRHRLGEGGS